jgi:hypothetical protein
MFDIQNGTHKISKSIDYQFTINMLIAGEASTVAIEMVTFDWVLKLRRPAG